MKKLYKMIFILGAVLFLLLVTTFNNCTSQGAAGNGSNSLSSYPNPSPSPAAGPAQFTNVVVPELEAQCMKCHNTPINGGTASVDIYQYTYMKNMITPGPTSVNNPLINKMQNIVAHTGGNVCLQGVLAPPCLQVVNWYETEFTTSTSGIAGGIYAIDVLGNVMGYAEDVNNTSNAITVYVYVDGPVGTGTSVGSYPANMAGGGIYAGHQFAFALPSTAANGQQHSLYIYGEAATANNLLPGAPQVYTAYTPTAAGMSYFNSSVLPKMNTCVNCHGNQTYAELYQYLVSPTPAQGGTASNNLLIDKASGLVTHGGGNVCGGINGAPCAQFQQWWTLEFN